MKDGVVCQDKVFTSRFQKGRGAIAALADGAGSCTHAHYGAQFVVEALGDLFIQNFEDLYHQREGVSGRILNELVRGLEDLAVSHNVALKQLSSTLMFAAAFPGKKHFKFVSGHLGDGVIGVLNNGRLSVLSSPDNDEYANSTCFVTSGGAESRFRIYKGELSYNSGFILMTDGAAESLYHRRQKVLAPACLRIFSWIDNYPQKKINRILEKNMEILRTYTRDDCGLALIKYVNY